MTKSIVGMLGIAAILTGISSAPMLGQAAKEKSLYDRLGGKQSIAKVVDEFVGRVAALDALHVGAHEKDQLLGALAPMKGEIVGRARSLS